AGAADTSPRQRGARVLPHPPAARGVTRAAPGARAFPPQRRAAPAHGARGGTLAGPAGGMTCRLPGGAALLVPALVATAALANPVAVPFPVRRALRAASVVVLPAGCGGVLAASPELVATALHCIDRGAALHVRASDGGVFEARLEATDADADQAVLR